MRFSRIWVRTMMIPRHIQSVRPSPLRCLLATASAVSVVLTLLFAIPAAAQPAGTTQSPTSRWAFIICGHPGDDAHRKLFAESTEQIRKALTERFGFPAKNVWIRFGADDRRASERQPPDEDRRAGRTSASSVESRQPPDNAEPPTNDQPSITASRGPATKEALAADASELQKLARADDELWVIVIGHAHTADRAVHLNLPGPDVSPAEFARWFADFSCRRSVFFLTTPLSGYFVKPLARPGRVLISATEPDLETNETLFPSSLAKMMDTFPDGDKHDIDKDGVNSLLDLYLAVALDVAKRYTDEELLATEHAQLDDNGDGRASELQLPYYAEEDPAAKPAPRPTKTRAGADGALARSIDLGRIIQKPSNSATKQ
jgi:hypothetical protein